MSTHLSNCNVELLPLTRAKSSTLQPNKRVLVYYVHKSKETDDRVERNKHVDKVI